MEDQQQQTHLRLIELEDEVRRLRGERAIAAKAAERATRGKPVTVEQALATLAASQRGELRR